MGFNDSSWYIICQVRLSASVFRYIAEKTDRQTDRQTNAGEDPTSATSIDVGN